MFGAVASAVHYLVKGILKRDKHVTQIYGTSAKGLEIIDGQIASQKGLGQECVLRFFEGIPAMHKTDTGEIPMQDVKSYRLKAGLLLTNTCAESGLGRTINPYTLENVHTFH